MHGVAFKIRDLVWHRDIPINIVATYVLTRIDFTRESAPPSTTLTRLLPGQAALVYDDDANKRLSTIYGRKHHRTIGHLPQMRGQTK